MKWAPRMGHKIKLVGQDQHFFQKWTKERSALGQWWWQWWRWWWWRQARSGPAERCWPIRGPGWTCRGNALPATAPSVPPLTRPLRRTWLSDQTTGRFKYQFTLRSMRVHYQDGWVRWLHPPTGQGQQHRSKKTCDWRGSRMWNICPKYKHTPPPSKKYQEG